MIWGVPGAYARLLASVGINGCNVNSANAEPDVLSTARLRELARLAAAFRPWGVRLALSIDLASPQTLGGQASFAPSTVVSLNGGGPKLRRSMTPFRTSRASPSRRTQKEGRKEGSLAIWPHARGRREPVAHWEGNDTLPPDQFDPHLDGQYSTRLTPHGV